MLDLCIDDFSRVKLSLVEGQAGSDYVNASYIDVSGYVMLRVRVLLATPTSLSAGL